MKNVFSSILDNEIAHQIDDLLSSDEDSDYDITYEGIRNQGRVHADYLRERPATDREGTRV